MLALFYDSETTGLPDWKSPSESEHQPHIVELAAKLVDLESRDVVSSFGAVISPDGWTIPDEVAEIHGITTARASLVGVPEQDAVRMLMGLWRRREVRIGHNESFDARILRIAQHRGGYSEEELAEWKEGAAKCTARMSSPFLKLPATDAMKKSGRFFHKTPKLSEAYEHFFGVKPAELHSAMADVDSCMAIYFEMVDKVEVAA